MTTKVKTQATATPAPAVAGKVGGTSLFESQETSSEEDAIAEASDRAVAASSDPPDAQLQRTEQQGHHFEQIEVTSYTPAVPIQRRIQRSPAASVKERWEDGAVSLKPLEQDPLAAKISPTGERWEDGAVTLKAESTHGASPPAIQAEGQEGSFAAGSQIEGRLQNSKGGGQPLPDTTRNFMESRFGNDFSSVRVHNNAESVQMNQSLQAQAFTHGNDIYFNSGKYNPESSGGKRLLAHELTHTIQQTGPSAIQPKRLEQLATKPNKHPAPAASPSKEPPIQRRKISQMESRPVGRSQEEVTLTIQPQLVVGAVGDRYEQEADRMADYVVQQTADPQPIEPAPSEVIARSPAISAAPGDRLQRGKKDKIKKDVSKAVKGIKEEVDSKKTPESETTEADKGANTGESLADDAKRELGNAKSEKKAKKAAKKLKKKAKQKSDQVKEEADRAKEKEAKKEEEDKAKTEQEELAEAEKQAQDSEEANPNGEEALPPAEADSTVEAGEATDELLPTIGVPEQLPDPGLVQAPQIDDPQTPTSPDDDPAFAAAVKQTEHVAAEQTIHQPAEDKAQEAQDAANDPAQQSRRAQSTQSNEAGDKEPQLFDREAFVNALLAVLESNKPKSQKDVEEGKGMDGASDAMSAQIEEAKEGSGGELKDSATREPDPGSEQPKDVTPTPDPVAEAGEKPPDELIDPAAATPKPKSQEEVEKPLEKTQQAIADLVPKNKKDLPPLQAKLMVGAPGDKYEREADRMADSVMAMPEPKIAAEPPKPNKAEVPATAPLTAQTAPAIEADTPAEEGEATEEETVQRQPRVQDLPDLQLLPGLYLQRKATLEAETPTQEGNAVPLDEHRLKEYEKEAGVNATGALKEGEQHFGGEAQKEFRATETSNLQETQSSQAESITGTNQDMFASRVTEFTNIHATQQEAQTQDESDRGRVTQEIQNIYDETKVNVNTVLGRMDSRVNAEFTATDKRAKAVFERRQKQLFKEWKNDYYKVRHPLYIPWIEVKTGWAYVKIRFILKPFFNTPLWLVNKIFTGLPDEVNQIYEVAREDYLAVQREGVHRIADIVEEEMGNAKAEVDRGRARVKEYVDALPEDLKSVGAEAASNIQSQFDSLESDIQAKQHALVDDLKSKYEASLKEIDDRIEELKAANASLVSKIAKAIADVAKWILRQVVNILKPPLSLIPGIGSKVGDFLDAFIDDPGGIMKTLFKGLGEGFKNFGKNIMKHMINGFFEWLLGSGIQIKFPDKFDLQGVIDILMQILGISKDAIFDLAASLLPDWAVEFLKMIMEKGAGALSNMMDTLKDLGVPEYVIGFFKAIAEFPKKGILALWDFIKTIFSSLKGDFIKTVITQLVIPEVVIAGIQWLIGLLNPVGGIFKIVKAIVDIIIFLIDNRDMIAQVLMAVADSFSALLTKSWAPIALAVEFALAKIIPLALGLMVSLLGLGGIPKKIGKVVEKLRKPVDKGLAKVLEKIGFLLDPVGTIQGGVSGMRDRAASKKNKKKGGKDSDRDDDDDKTTTTKAKDTNTSTKDKSQPADTSTTKKPSKTDAQDAASGKKTQDKSGKKKDDDDKKKKDDDDDKKKKDDDDTKKRLTAAMNSVDRIAEAKKDPSAVKKELTGVKKKNDLDSLTLKEKGKEKYQVIGKAKATASSSKKKVQRKKAKGSWTDENNQISVKKRLKASKSKGGSFTVDAKLEEKDAVLKKVEKTLKRYIKLNARTDIVEKHLTRLKGQYKLKTLKLVKLMPDGSVYKILGEVSKGKSAQRQPAPGPASVPWVQPGVEDAIQRAEGHGQAIAPHVRMPLEDSFGMDFSPVRIHTDNEGDRLSRSLQANAFTTGQDIFFRQGAYAPETPGGKHLLAHELTHVVQQSGEQPAVMPSRIQRQAATPPPIQRSPHLWIQREEAEDSSDAGSGISGGAIAGGVAMAAGGMAVSAGTSIAADMAVDAAASKLMPGAKIKSRISSDKTNLTMDVKVKKRDIDFDKDKEAQFEDEEPEEDGLPTSIVNDIVRVIQDIVNQNPDPDVVARKLNKVRVMFEMQVVKLVRYAEVGQSFEYTVKINGRAKFLRASKIASFLKRLGAGKRGATAPPEEDTDSPKDKQTVDSPPTDKAPTSPDKSVDKPKANTSEPKSASKDTEQPPESAKTTPDAVGTDPEPIGQSPKVKPLSTAKKGKSKAKLEQAQEREMKAQSKVRRIDAETVDVIIRANPQPQSRE